MAENVEVCSYTLLTKFQIGPLAWENPRTTSVCGLCCIPIKALMRSAHGIALLHRAMFPASIPRGANGWRTQLEHQALSPWATSTCITGNG